MNMILEVAAVMSTSWIDRSLSAAIQDRGKPEWGEQEWQKT